MSNKVTSLLGFAARSRNLVTGYNTCINTINKNKIKLIILAKDLAENSKEKMTRLCQSKDIKYYEYGEINELSQCTGKSYTGIFGITDENFAQAISKEIDIIQSKKEAE